METYAVASAHVQHPLDIEGIDLLIVIDVLAADH
jgi:hypothetical protein